MICLHQARVEAEKFSSLVFDATGRCLLPDLCRLVVTAFLDVEFQAFEHSLFRNHGIFDGHLFDFKVHAGIRDSLWKELQDGSATCWVFRRFIEQLRGANGSIPWITDIKSIFLHSLRFSVAFSAAAAGCQRVLCYYGDQCTCGNPIYVSELVAYRRIHDMQPDCVVQTL